VDGGSQIVEEIIHGLKYFLMAEFCSKCEPEYWDIDLVQIALDLEPGHSESFLCEGCNIRGIYKDDYGYYFFARNINGKIELEKVIIEKIIKLF
jgi:hypothetical protein